MAPHLKTLLQKTLFFLAPTFWFLVGFTFAAITMMSVVLIYFQQSYKDRALPGVFVGNINVSEKDMEQIKSYFDKKNEEISKSSIIYSYGDLESTVSAKTLNLGYDSGMIATQAVTIGKSGNLFTDFYLILDSYINGTTLPFSYTFNKEALKNIIDPMQAQIHVNPVDAEFTEENGRVKTFKQSSNGRTVDYKRVEDITQKELGIIINSHNPVALRVDLPVRVLEPKISTEKANKYGIDEVIGEGNSLFLHAIANRVYNITLAATRVNGVLLAPGEEFSFAKAVGDVSRLTGYKEGYIIQNGRTILGDGGGICQVSTTLFRAVLNAGLPITERHGHAYRVGYYEQDSPPGLDATVFVPSVDFRFKNDTKNYILVQSYINPDDYSLKFLLFGKKDGRQVTVTKPVVMSQTPPPEASYQDDPTLPKGVVKQVDFAAWGAKVNFSRTVLKDGKPYLQDSFATNYQPWRAVYLRGTKE